MQGKVARRLLLALVALLALTIVGCPSSSSSDTYTLSGTLTKSGVDDCYAYLKLVALGEDGTGAALYWTKSSAFSGGTATYSIGDIEEGSYTGYAFIDGDGDAVEGAAALPDSDSDYATDGGQDFIVDHDIVADLPEEAWVPTGT